MIAPIPLGARPTVALGLPFEPPFYTERAPVILHRLGGEKDRERCGPRELREATCAAFEKAGWPERWGLGGVCVEMDDAANFAIAGYSWFTFDLARRLDAFADEASLDALDARIVALEDSGCYKLGWHEPYLGEGFDEEALARAAVKFGPALAHAEQMQQAMRTMWSGRGELPDIELSIARALRRTTALELRFLASELNRRGIWVSVLAPCLGPDFQPGLITDELPEIAGFAEILSPIRLAAPGASHLDQTDAALFGTLRRIAENEPSLFREILLAARNAFPLICTDWHLSVSDEDVQTMPQPDDDALASTFLDHPHGRQLLLSTWEAVCEPLGERIRACAPLA